MRRLGRPRFVAYAVLTLLVLLGGTRLVLSSDIAADRVADRLGVLLGVPVRVSRVDIGLGGDSSVQGLQIFEADNARPDVPWVTATDLRTDFSAVDMLGTDAMPSEVVLTGAAVELRFAEDGTLVTRLPTATDSKQPMPRLRFENARLTIKQAGRERRPLVVTGVNADFTLADRTFRFAGTCTDSFWGEWTVNGSYDITGDVFHLSLRTARAEATEEKLKLLPFIPDDVWSEVKITEGVTPAELDLTAHGTDPVKYRFRLKPEKVRVFVSSIDLDADQASGDVVIEDSVIRLRDVKGRTAGGAIGTEADLDFHGDIPRLDFRSIWVKDVDLLKLPESWKLKQHKISGKLSGKTNLVVQIKPEGADMTGTGSGEVTVEFFPLPIQLKLVAANDKLRIFPSGRSGLIPGL